MTCYLLAIAAEARGYSHNLLFAISADLDP